jgi:acid-activated urea channel
VGVLGVYLLFVGIVLTVNGVNRLYGIIDPKSLAIMNLITAAIIVLGTFINFARATTTLDYLNVASGFLFGFTYVFIAANNLFGLDWRIFGWFSLFVTIYALFQGILAIQAGDWGFTYLWIVWALLWLNGFLDTVVGMPSMGRIFPYLSIAIGIFAAFIPALLMLTDRWTF